MLGTLKKYFRKKIVIGSPRSGRAYSMYYFYKTLKNNNKITEKEFEKLIKIDNTSIKNYKITLVNLFGKARANEILKYN